MPDALTQALSGSLKGSTPSEYGVGRGEYTTQGPAQNPLVSALSGSALQKEGPISFKASIPGGSIETFKLVPGVGQAQTIAGWKHLMEPYGYKFIEELPMEAPTGVGPTGQFTAPSPVQNPLASAPATPALTPQTPPPAATPPSNALASALTSTQTSASMPAAPKTTISLQPTTTANSPFLAKIQNAPPPPPGQYMLTTASGGGSNIDFPNPQFRTLQELVQSMAQNGVQVTGVQAYKFPWEPDSKISDAQRQFVGQLMPQDEYAGQWSSPKPATQGSLLNDQIGQMVPGSTAPEVPQNAARPLAQALSAPAQDTPAATDPYALPWNQPQSAAASGMMPDQRFTLNLDGTTVGAPASPPPARDVVANTATPPSSLPPLNPPGVPSQVSAPTSLAQALSTPSPPAISPWAITDTPQPRPEGDVVLLKNQDGKYNWVQAGGGFQSGKSYEIKRTSDGKTYWAEANLGAPLAQALSGTTTTSGSYPAIPGPTLSLDPNNTATPPPSIDPYAGQWTNTPPPVSAPASPPAASGPPPITGYNPFGGPPPTPPPAAIPPTPPGTLTEDQYRQLVNSGQLPKDDTRPVVEEYGNVNSTAGLGLNNATAGSLPKDLTDALNQLIQEARNQGLQGQQNFEGVIGDLRNFLDFNRDSTTQTMGRQDDLINQLMGRINPALDSAFAGANTREGLSPEALAAMRTQATEGTTRDYQGNVEALKTELARRGAAGGMTPAAFDETVRGYGNLQASRDASRSKQLQDIILADEQRKFESLGLNRQREANALGTAAGLTGTLGSVYNPGQFLGASGDALGQLTAALGAQNAAGTGAINQAGNLAGTLLGNQSEAARLAENARQADQSNTTANRALDLELKNTSTTTLLRNAAISTGLSWLDELIFGDDNNGNDNDETSDNIGSPGGALSGGAKQVAGAIKSGLGAAGAGLASAGKAVAGLMTNPVTAAIGAAILTATLWMKSQAHHEANTWVQGFQNPFDKQVGDLNVQFANLAQSGNLKKSEAMQIRSAIVGMIADYEAKRQAFSRKGSDEKKVADQAKATADEWYGVDYEPYIQKLDDVIARLT